MDTFQSTLMGKRLRQFLLGVALFILAVIFNDASGTQAALAEEAADAAAAGVIKVPTLNIPIMKKMAVRGQMTVDLVLDMRDPELAQAIVALMPRLQADYTSRLSRWSAIYQDVRAPANVIGIKRQLQDVTNTLLDSSDAEVLLQGVMLQRRG
ncbi:MAG TPA: hypothetical protein DCO73_14040 [Alphaproteobacteria bacterium]|nr:hypothetical protein [Alphaproteobacteria bacterium]